MPSPAAGHSLLPCSWTFKAVENEVSATVYDGGVSSFTAQAFPTLFIALSDIRILCCVCNHVVVCAHYIVRSLFHFLTVLHEGLDFDTINFGHRYDYR